MDDQAVSPVIGVILMAAIVTFGSAVVYILLNDLGSQDSEPTIIYDDGSTACFAHHWLADHDAWCERNDEIVCRFYWHPKAGIPNGCFATPPRGASG